MNKALKITGIIAGAIILIAAFLIIVTASMNSSRINSPGYPSDMGVAGLSSDSWSESSNVAFSSPSSVSSAMKGSLEVAPMPSQDLPTVDKKVIKNGNLNLQVEKTDSAADKINQIAKANNGEVFSSNFRQTKSNVKSGTVTVKVPVANFEKTFNELKKIATLVINESTSGQDVTEQYTDLQAQLKNKQAEEQTFVKILDQAGKIDDVLAVTREIARVRGNIEQLQGRIRFMDSQTDMSTISVNLTEDTNISVVDSWRPVQVIKEAFNSLMKSLQGLVDFLIQFIIVALPMLLIWAVIFVIIYKIGRKIYFKFKNKNVNNQNNPVK